MSDVSDEMLMAYADGELSAAERRQVEACLARDPAASRRLEIFAGTPGLLREAFGGAASEPIPDRLLDTILGVVPAAVAVPVRRATVEQPSFLSQLRSFLLPLTPAHAVGAAAALVLAFGIDGATRQMGLRGPGTEPLVVANGGKLFAQGPLQQVLDGAPSGTAVAFGSGAGAGSIKAVMTFKRQDGQPCRIYELDQASSGAANGVGCRNVAGQWALEVHSGIAAAKSKPGQVVPAAGPASPVVDAAVDRMISGDAFGPEEEAKLITNKWRP
jgi:anti-sigma factor RsiW